MAGIYPSQKVIDKHDAEGFRMVVDLMKTLNPDWLTLMHTQRTTKQAVEAELIRLYKVEVEYNRKLKA